MELEALQDVWAEIAAWGATLVAISPQRAEYLRQMKQQHRLRFDLLRDAENAVAGQFELVYKFPAYLKRVYEAAGIDLGRFNGEVSWSLPMPARYVIDRDARIRAREVNPDYIIRPEPEQIVEALKQLLHG
jgi:peroxiredoxin